MQVCFDLCKRKMESNFANLYFTPLWVHYLNVRFRIYKSINWWFVPVFKVIGFKCFLSRFQCMAKVPNSSVGSSISRTCSSHDPEVIDSNTIHVNYRVHSLSLYDVAERRE